MPAGPRRHYISIESPPLNMNVLGEQSTETWTEVRTIYSQIEPLRGRALQDAKLLFAEVTHAVRFPWVPDIKANMRVKYHGRILHIGTVIDVDEHGRELELLCREIVA